MRACSSADKRSAWRRRTFSHRPFRPFEARIDLNFEFPKNTRTGRAEGECPLSYIIHHVFGISLFHTKNPERVGC